MINLNIYINICEAIDEDNLYYKLDKWFTNNEKLKSDFINIISHYRNNKVNKETLEFMLNNINFEVSKFVDFIIDNTDNKQEIDDYMYLMQKIVDSIVANKNNNYNV